jgi:hypothetical protein
MTQKRLWRCGLVVILSMALATPARAESLKTAAAEISIAIVVVGIAVGVGVTVLVMHYSRKRSVTGCVTLGTSGMMVTDEGDKRIYALAGSTGGITPGNRMKLQGKRVKSADKTRVWEASKVNKDFGVCPP